MKKFFKRLGKFLLWTILLLTIATVIVINSVDSFGKMADKSTREVSKHYKDGRYQNEITTTMLSGGTFWKVLGRFWESSSEQRQPAGELPYVAIPLDSLRQKPSDSLAVYWLGHASVLLEMEGKRYLLDPVFSERTSMVQWIGPKRHHPSPLALEDLPPVDGVLISHNHYDHLDFATVKKLAATPTIFYVPSGVAASLQMWGVREKNIVELDWWQHFQDGNVKLVATPARHFSGRGIWDSNQSFWCSWSLLGEKQRVFYTGDSGMMPGYAEIGEKFGGFDLTLMAIGAYDEAWIDIHLTPEQAVEAHQQLQGKYLLPVHWATFDLALHHWLEPAERLVAEAVKKGVPVLTPLPGQKVTLQNVTSVAGQPWWNRIKNLK